MILCIILYLQMYQGTIINHYRRINTSSNNKIFNVFDHVVQQICSEIQIIYRDLLSFLSIIVFYQQNMSNSSKQFTYQDNLAVIKLIKQKFKPLQNTKQQSIFKKQNMHTQSSHHEKNTVSLPSISSIHLKKILEDCVDQDKNLLKRVKNYLHSKNLQKNVGQQTAELKKYIQLFQKPIENEIKQRHKRQSIELHIINNQNLKNNSIFNLKILQIQKEQLNEQQRSIFNAKIRRKLNHKKIIDLAKRN